MRKTDGDYVWTTLFEGYLWGGRYSGATSATDVVPTYHLNVIKYPKWRSSIMVFGQKSNEHIWGLSNCYEHRISEIEDWNRSKNKLFGNDTPDHFIGGFNNFIMIWNYLGNSYIPRICVLQRNFLPSLLRSCSLSISISISLFLTFRGWSFNEIPA